MLIFAQAKNRLGKIQGGGPISYFGGSGPPRSDSLMQPYLWIKKIASEQIHLLLTTRAYQTSVNEGESNSRSRRTRDSNPHRFLKLHLFSRQTSYQLE